MQLDNKELYSWPRHEPGLLNVEVKVPAIRPTIVNKHLFLCTLVLLFDFLLTVYRWLVFTVAVCSHLAHQRAMCANQNKRQLTRLWWQGKENNASIEIHSLKILDFKLICKIIVKITLS